MSIFIIMDYTKDLIRKILREQTEFGKYKPDFGRVDVSGDFSVAGF